MDIQELTSLGNTPGAIVLTLTPVPANVVASILPKCVAAALLLAYANCPLLLPFIYPEILLTFTTELVYPGVTSLPLARSGKNVMLIQKMLPTFVRNVSAQLSGVDLRKCAEMADGSDMSGWPLSENFVASSRAMPALLTRRWRPLGSFSESSL